MAPRHRAFIGANLIAGFAALAALPLYLAWIGAIDGGVVVAFALLAAQAPVALLLSRSGRFELACVTGSTFFAAFVAWVAAISGGLSSPAIVWMILVPAEAALWGCRRTIVASVSIAAIAVAALAVAAMGGLLPHAYPSSNVMLAMQMVVVLGALVYGGMVGIRSESFHRSAVEDLALREARLELVSENMSDAVTLHAANGDVLFTSPAMRRVLGIRVDDVLGTGLFHRVHVADRPAFLKTLSDTIADGEPSSVEFRAFTGEEETRAPEYIWLEMRCQPFKVPDDISGGARVVAVTRDVTARKIQETQLEQARETAENASAAKMRFLANVSHELRTPLNAIIGFSEILCESDTFVDQAERTREYAKLIHDSGHHLLQVVNDILDMSKIESGNFEIVAEPFDMVALIDNCRRLMEHQAQERNVQLRMTVPADLPEIAADRRACKQILLNLLSNAVKFTDAGGLVEITSRRLGTQIELVVSDTGIGIAEKDLPNLGTPFFQADSGYDRRHDGTGLGLSVVSGLVRLHGGTVDFTSRLGRGTTVTLRMPINCEVTAESLEHERQARIEARKADAAAQAVMNGTNTGGPARLVEAERVAG